MLKLYRRHGRTRKGVSTCKHKKSQFDPWMKCDCPIHVVGMVESSGKFLRRFTGTRTLSEAQAKAALAASFGDWPDLPEEQSASSGAPGGKLVADAIDEFLKEAKSEKGRNLRQPTYVKYQGLLGRLPEEGPSRSKTPSYTLKQYCADRNILTLDQISVEQLRDFRNTWRMGSRATVIQIQRLRTFFRFCMEMEWTQRNPAMMVKPPKKIKKVQKWPFSPTEMDAILEAARTLPLNPQQPIQNDDLEAFILVMRYSGLRLSDAGMLTVDRLQGDELFLYTMKGDDRMPVYAPLPHQVADKLRSLAVKQGKYFFCTGSTKLETNDELWLRRLKKVWELCRANGLFKADEPKPTSHRFRHTFAVELLKSGEADINDVSMLLGHTSVKITEQHYAAWVPQRQQRLADKVRRAHEKQNRK